MWPKSWRRPLSYRTQLLCKSMDWFLYDNGLRPDLVTFTEEILNGKLHYLCSEWAISPQPFKLSVLFSEIFWWSLDSVLLRVYHKNILVWYLKIKTLYTGLVRNGQTSEVKHQRTCVYQGVKNVCYSENFDGLCFLETPDLRFALLPCYRRNKPWS